MMKVYTQTWYRGNNYGSVLQAYALQHTISDMGYACSVLNYKPTKADMWKLKFINHSLKETIQYKINEYLMKKNGASEAVNNLSLFDDFRAQHMQITPRVPLRQKLLGFAVMMPYSSAEATRFGIHTSMILTIFWRLCRIAAAKSRTRPASA